VVTTALIPGRAAPLLISEDAVKAMKPGSVIIDMAAQNGGNCAYTEKGKTVVQHGVKIVGTTNFPSEMAVHASQMYARTLMAMVLEFYGDEGFTHNFEDEIFKGSCVTHNGEVINERVKRLLAG
ncbi:MAG: NAD(P)(+) transhydrogenase (Re/Si-specific) subunit alpha, partial [Bacteroidota bacterium]